MLGKILRMKVEVTRSLQSEQYADNPPDVSGVAIQQSFLTVARHW